MSKLAIVMYHYVRPIKSSNYPNIKGLEFDLFRQQLEFFRDNFQVVTMEQVIDSLDGNTSLPENAMLLTFDDGYSDHYRYVFPLLKEFGMQGSFFVPSGILKNHQVLDVNKIHFILASVEIKELLPRVFHLLDQYRQQGYEMESNAELFEKLAVANRWDNKETIFVKRLLQSYLDEELRGKIVDTLFLETVGVSEEEFSKELYMNMDQVREMKEAGMFFGIHGERHYWLNHLPVEKMQQDILNGLEYFKSVIDEKYLVVNYPYGGYNDDVLNFCREIGCRLGFSVEARIADLECDNPLILPRLDTNDFPPRSENYKKIELFDRK